MAILMKLRDPGHDVVVLERNPAGITCRWGGVLGRPAGEPSGAHDPVTAHAIGAEAFRWVDQHVVVDSQPAASRAGYGFRMRRPGTTRHPHRQGAGARR
jgi:anthraniloyl-CoA monooxygenase